MKRAAISIAAALLLAIPTTAAAYAGTVYPVHIQRTYMHRCERGGGSAKLCSCTLDYFEAHTRLHVFLHANKAKSRRLIYRAVDACWIYTLR